MNIPRNDIKYKIAQKLFDYYVINDKYMAVQMPDGRYVPRRVKCTPLLLFDMLEQGASLGVYQQQYKRKWMKWVCLDFDCKDPCFLEDLLEKYVLPAARKLEKLGIHYLAEFSGRRGIHLWILTKGIISKEQGFKIVECLGKEYKSAIHQEEVFGLDLFPAVAGGGIKFGKQVKLPLSVHRKGGQSFFIPDILNYNMEEWRNLPEKSDFWQIQFGVLQSYVPNDLEVLWKRLRISPDKEQQEKGLLYKKEYLIAENSLSLYDIQKACEGCSVFYGIMKRALEGNLRYLDRLILSGCFGHMKNDELLWDIMKQQNNYKENVTRHQLSKLNKNYPVTIQYLYDLYGEQLESELDPHATVIEYIAEQLGLSVAKIMESKEEKELDHRYWKKEKDSSYFRMIRDKELCYMCYDDEVLAVNDYLEMSGMKQYDFKDIKEKFFGIINGDEVQLENSPSRYSLYKRWEEGKEEPRILVSLCPKDRVLTTALIYELVETMGIRFHSYSYNLNFFYEKGSDFIPWYDAWKRFQENIENYLYLDIFKNYGLIKLDLTRFYDSIYVHALFKQMEEINGVPDSEEAKKRINCILRYLGIYTEQLMYKIKGEIRGVPQGPAYARVFAELFLTAVIDSFFRQHEKWDEKCDIIRYVDDIYIVYRGIDGKQLLNEFSDYIRDRGLEINWNKTKVFERISEMREFEKQSIFEAGAANYAIKSIQGVELEDEDSKQENMLEFEKYLKRKGFLDIRDANFILNRYLDSVFVERYLDEYAEFLIQQNTGRGSIYKRLYEEIFQRDKWLRKFFRNKLYRKIPCQTVNFKNFISVCYFSILRIRILGEDEKKMFIQWLQDEENMDIDDKGTARAIVQLLGEK